MNAQNLIAKGDYKHREETGTFFYLRLHSFYLIFFFFQLELFVKFNPFQQNETNKLFK